MSTEDPDGLTREQCTGGPGQVVPVIDRNRCEGVGECVRVCPCEVFEIRNLAAEDRAGLGLLGRLKAWMHGNRQAYVAEGADCHLCQLCVAACPENAIRLVPLLG